MSFKGLFIGIDRYSSAEINCLSCARRDATALRALFMDTFGGTGTLLRPCPFINNNAVPTTNGIARLFNDTTCPLQPSATNVDRSLGEHR